MNRLIELPAGLELKHQNLHLRGKTGGPGKGTSQREQIMVSENRIWHGQIDFTFIGEDLRLAMRSVATRLNGRVNILRIRVHNEGTPVVTGSDSAFWRSLGYSEAAIAAGFQTYADGSGFSDGTGFALPDTGEPVVRLALPVGADACILDGYIGRNALPGARFSHQDFLYEVTENNDGAVQFAPPLRAPIPAGARVEMSSPAIRMRLAADEGFEPFERFGRFVDPFSATLEEEFHR